jgi:hypothetical protein
MILSKLGIEGDKAVRSCVEKAMAEAARKVKRNVKT